MPGRYCYIEGMTHHMISPELIDIVRTATPFGVAAIVAIQAPAIINSLSGLVSKITAMLRVLKG